MYTDEELTEAVSKATSYSGTLRMLGRKVSGSAHKALKKRIESQEISVQHFVHTTARQTASNKKEWQEILVKDESLTHRRSGKMLTRALVESGEKHECKGCELKDEWMGKPIKLEVDHIDGSWQNNLKENLRFLCPNCHSQTDTFFKKKKSYYCSCGKKKYKTSDNCISCSSKRPKMLQRKVERPDKGTLAEEIETESWCALGRKYGVSDNAVRKWARSYGLL